MNRLQQQKLMHIILMLVGSIIMEEVICLKEV